MTMEGISMVFGWPQNIGSLVGVVASNRILARASEFWRSTDIVTYKNIIFSG